MDKRANINGDAIPRSRSFDMTKKVLEVFPEGHEKAGQLTGVVRVDFDDKSSISIDVNSLNEETKFRALIHGISQKVGDSYAGAKSDSNPLEFAKTAAKETIEQVLKGEWRAPSTSSGPRESDLAKALSLATGETLEKAIEFIANLDDEAIKVLRKKPKVAAQLAAIAAQKAIAKAAKLAKEAEAATE
jgi:hypothetical protein